jgi:DNA polymerase sigma
MALPGSDLDVCVTGPLESATPWNDLAPHLQKMVGSTGSVQVIASSKIPVVKVRDPVYGYNIDVTFGHQPLDSVKLIKKWDAEMDRLKPLVLIVKYLLQQRCLNLPYTGGLSSFCVVVMVRHFLLTLRRERKAKLNEQSPLGPLLLGFLRYFGPRFLYQELGVCADGTLVSKEEVGLEKDVFVVLNPLEARAINCAASAFRMADVVTMFAVVDEQLRRAVCLDLEAPDAPFPSALSAVVWPDEAIVQRRQRIKDVTRARARNRSGGKGPKKTLKVDPENRLQNLFA